MIHRQALNSNYPTFFEEGEKFRITTSVSEALPHPTFLFSNVFLNVILEKVFVAYFFISVCV